MTAKPCPSSYFKVALAACIDGVKQLNAAGVPNNEAAELVGRLWTDACNEASSAHYAANPPQAAGGPLPGSAYPTDKAGVIAAFKADVVRLGITEADMAKHFGDFERKGPTAGNGNGDTAPIVEQTREARHETAEGSTDATTPAGGPSDEPTTGLPPETEPSTGGKPAKPAKPKAHH